MSKRVVILFAILIISLVLSAIRVAVSSSLNSTEYRQENTPDYKIIVDSILIDVNELLPHFELINGAIKDLERDPTHFVDISRRRSEKKNERGDE